MAIIIHMTSSCTTNSPKSLPAIIPAIEMKPKTSHPLGIIGGTEPVYLEGMVSPFISRIDTGAQTSSIDVAKEKFFERDGKRWVAFTIINSETNESKVFEKVIEDQIAIKRVGGNERRVIVVMDIKMGGQSIKERFTLAEREKFKYQILIGRNILNGRAIVDPALNVTLK
ncbi:MAG: RimK/LysX family protein [Alphaproteobacteria bacterium]|nr:RimK/LysX family protein [Alphaproteobacteria bacterium]